MNWHSGTTIILKWLHLRIRTNFLMNLTAQIWKRLCFWIVMCNLSLEAAREWVPICLRYCHTGLCSFVAFELDDLKGLPTMWFYFLKKSLWKSALILYQVNLGFPTAHMSVYNNYLFLNYLLLAYMNILISEILVFLY